MAENHSATDLRDWVTAAQRGDKKAFSEIVRRFQNMAYAIAYAMLGDAGLAHDAAQEAFIEAYLSLPMLREPAAFPGWFRRVVIKHSDRELRSRRPTIALDETMGLPNEVFDPVTAVEAAEDRRAIHQAIAELPAAQRQIITLFYLRDYSQKEIEEFLELPVSTIKKSLFVARKKLKGRLETMVEHQVRSNRPSQTDAFAEEVQFLLALRTGDLESLKSLVKRRPDLLEIRFAAPITRERHYWPVGGNALHWAAVTGDETLLEFLLSREVNLELTDRFGMTALHTAVLMGQEAMVNRLPAARANPNAVTDNGHTPLHLAVMRNNNRAANALIEAGAQIDVPDKNGRTPIDWAVSKNARSSVELLTKHGAEHPATAKVPEAVPAGAASLLETGIKAIDLFAPLVRGGHNGILTPYSNVGALVLLGELVHRMGSLYGARTICLGLDDEVFTSRDVQLLFREAGVGEIVTVIFGHIDDSAEDREQVLKTALTKAAALRAEGREVFFLVFNNVALYEVVAPRLKAMSRQDAGMTALYFGDESAGAEPEPLADLDAVIGFDFARAKQQLYPAVDPIHCRSRLVQNERISEAHRQIAAQARRFFRRHLDLQPIIESRGLDLLPKAHDREIVERARRLDRFLTQPFYWAEPWTNVPGVHVPLSETLEGCRAILSGNCDDLPEEAFYFVGNLASAREKAK
jgi:RNA polymerase sigma factor (sigma-70 family)